MHYSPVQTATKIRLVREHGSVAQGRACRVDDQQGIPLRKRATQGWNLMLRKHWLGYLPTSAAPLDWPFRFWYRYRPLSMSTMTQKPADIPAETCTKTKTNHQTKNQTSDSCKLANTRPLSNFSYVVISLRLLLWLTESLKKLFCSPLRREKNIEIAHRNDHGVIALHHLYALFLETLPFPFIHKFV